MSRHIKVQQGLLLLHLFGVVAKERRVTSAFNFAEIEHTSSPCMRWGHAEQLVDREGAPSMWLCGTKPGWRQDATQPDHLVSPTSRLGSGWLYLTTMIDYSSRQKSATPPPRAHRAPTRSSTPLVMAERSHRLAGYCPRHPHCSAPHHISDPTVRGEANHRTPNPRSIGDLTQSTSRDSTTAMIPQSPTNRDLRQPEASCPCSTSV